MSRTETVGDQGEPKGLGESITALPQPLLEPNPPTALVPGRNIRIMVGNRCDDFQYSSMVATGGLEPPTSAL